MVTETTRIPTNNQFDYNQNQQPGAAPVESPEIDMAFVNDFMKEINDIA